MKIALIGPQGSGKSTLGKALSEHYVIPLITMGDILRNPDMYPGVREIMGDYDVHDGSLLSDEKLIQICYLVLDHHGDNWIFDGVPRQLKQYDDMVKMFPPDVFVILNVAQDIAIERLLSRHDGRLDDTEENILKRLRIYTAVTLPVVYLIKERKTIPYIEIQQKYRDTKPEHVFNICVRELNKQFM